MEPALSPPLAPAGPPAGRGRGRGRGRAGGGVAGAAACGVLRGGGAGRPRRGGTMELGAQPRGRRRNRGPVSAGCGRPDSSVLAPSLLGSGPSGCPGGGAGAGRAPAAPWLSEVAASRRALSGGQRGPLRAAAPPRALPCSPAASSALAPAPAGASRRCSAARRLLSPAPSSPVLRRGTARCVLPGLRSRRLPSRPQLAPGPPLAPHAQCPGLPRVRDFHIPRYRAPCPHVAQSPHARRPGSGPLHGFALPAPLRRVPPPQGLRARGAPGLRSQARLPERRAGGRTTGERRAAGRGERAALPGAASRAWIIPGRLSLRGRRGPRRLASRPSPRRSSSEWKTFPSPSVLLRGNGDFFLV